MAEQEAAVPKKNGGFFVQGLATVPPLAAFALYIAVFGDLP
jgi:ABC-type proline/glycine betaine transport system permease subunit